MKNLEEIKEEVSFKYNCLSWDDLMGDVHSKAYEDPEKYYDEVAKRYACEVAEDLRKRIIQEAFDDPYDIRRYANSIRNVEIITP